MIPAASRGFRGCAHAPSEYLSLLRLRIGLGIEPCCFSRRLQVAKCNDQDIFVIIFIFVSLSRNKEVKIVSGSARPGVIILIRFKFLSFIKFIYNQMQNRVPSILDMNYLYVNRGKPLDNSKSKLLPGSTQFSEEKAIVINGSEGKPLPISTI